MSNTSITVHIDETTMKQASAIFEELGMDLSTGINVLLRALIRENGLPSNVNFVPEVEYREWIKQELQNSWEHRTDPDAKSYTTEEIRSKHRI